MSTPDIKLLTRPGLGDPDTISAIQEWLNERYADLVTSVAVYIGKRVLFASNRPGSTDRLSRYGGVTGKVTDVYFCLEDSEMLRYEVVLDYGGERVSGVPQKCFFISPITDEQVQAEKDRQKKLKEELEAKHRPSIEYKREDSGSITVTIEEWNPGVLPADWDLGNRPVGTIKLAEPRPASEQEAVGRRVRIIEASRFPDHFLKEGLVTKVFPYGFSGYLYEIKLNDGTVLESVTDMEVRFL